MKFIEISCMYIRINSCKCCLIGHAVISKEFCIIIIFVVTEVIIKAVVSMEYANWQH